MLIRSVSGVRFTIGGDTTPALISKYVEAFSDWVGTGSIVIGFDARPTGEWVRHLVVATLAAKGISIIDIGIAPTPTIQLAVKEFEAIGGISISASHNPQEWNGLKFLTKGGICLSQSENSQLYSLVDSKSTDYPQKYTEFSITTPNFDNGSLLELDFVKKTQLLSFIKEKNYHCVVDAVNASGSIRIPEFLEQLGCSVYKLYCDGSGVFPHTPEPITENLLELANCTKTQNANIGIAVDPDADRLVLIDENGMAIGEEKTIALATEAVLFLKNEFSLFEDYNSAVTVNLSTSKMVEDIAKKYGATIHRSPVGEVNVVEEMKRTKSVIGGEGSGGVILPASHYGRDSFVGIVLILGLMAVRNCSLSELSAELPVYSMIKMKKMFQGEFSSVIEAIQSIYAHQEIDTRDGIKVYFETSWVHIRTSNTEPIVRCIAEAPTESEAISLATTFIDLVP